MRLIIHLLDRISTWEVIRTSEVQNELHLGADESHTAIELHNFEVYEYIKKHLANNIPVRIPKNLSKELDLTDIITLQDDDLEIAKRVYLNKAQDLIYGVTINKLHLIDAYNFIVLNQWFTERGYVITETNKDEKYVEIIADIADMEDINEADTMLRKLEKFLNAKDKMSTINNIVTEFEIYEMKIKEASTEEEVLNIYENFMIQFAG